MKGLLAEREYAESGPGVLLLAAAVMIPLTSWGWAPWLMGVFSFLVFLVFLGEGRKIIITRRFSLWRSPIWVPFLIIFFLSLYHLAWSPVPYGSLLFLAQITVCLVFFHLLVSRPGGIPAKGVVLVWAGVLVSWILAEGFIFGSRAPGGPFLNRNYLATMILSCLAYLAGWAVDGSRRRERVFVPAAAVFFCAGSLLLIGSRSAAIGTVLILILTASRGRGWIRWASGAMIVFVLLAPSTLRHRVTQEYKVDPHAFSRIEIWKAALEMGADHPLAGVGPNLFGGYSPEYAFPVEDLPVRFGRIARKPHNDYLRSWAEGGAIGVIATGLFLFLTLRLMVRAWREGRTGPALAMGALLFQALFHDITEVFALMALAAWWLAHLGPEEKGKFRIEQGKGVILAVTVGLCLAGSAVWLTLDVASRTFWNEGKKLMVSDLGEAERSLAASLRLNPVSPGVALDLSHVHTMLARQIGMREDFERAQGSILRSADLNRLDTRPLRLQAALFEDLAKKRPGAAEHALSAAVELLDRARELEPHNALILVSQADIFWKLGWESRALELIDQALMEEPNYLGAHRKKVSFLSMLDPGAAADAELSLEKAKKRAAGYQPQSDYEEMILK